MGSGEAAGLSQYCQRIRLQLGKGCTSPRSFNQNVGPFHKTAFGWRSASCAAIQVGNLKLRL